MKFNIRIPADEFFSMTDQLEKEYGFEAADLVYQTLTNRMDPKDRDECSHISLKRTLKAMKEAAGDDRRQ